MVVVSRRAKKNESAGVGADKIRSKSRARKKVDSDATKLLNSSIDKKVSKMINRSW